jgi:sugar phosphate isomerase/epimerase
MYTDSEKTAPFAVYVHARQEKITRPIGEITIDYRKVRQILKSVGYNGYVSIEYSTSGDPLPVIPSTTTLLRDIFVLEPALDL